ncbi:sensor histidine kinase [Ornithinimicrobium ciconiae]|uniref:histidine kinase n=1 Tax=Ornithinimicrobium ciconiae TaxID=2594265 RepID=A0A516G6U5_9MICO|nr:histidine kinase [Ornithinimicrobium ciconiae]QDO87257.1 sensor histidine kinase [Ornithinimicrobium ciconiae]
MDRIAHLLGADEHWSRPALTLEQRRRDVVLAVGFYLLAALSLELMRSLGAFEGGSALTEILTQHGVAASAALLLVWRRSHPLLVASLATAHLYVSGSFEAMVAGSLVLQILYFFAIFSGVSWARDRRALGYVLLACMVALALWLAWIFAVSSGLDDIYRSLGITGDSEGIFDRPVAAVGYVTLNNLIFFGGAVLIGQVSWRGALHTQRELQYAETIRTQAARLRDQAVVAERLRIARELHDVVAHHVSVMGVQAAAARRVLEKNPDAAREALGAIEGSSRDAVGQMRDLLGTLRSGELAADGALEEAGEAPDRAPQPDLSDLEDLAAEATTLTCTVTYTLVEDRPGAAQEVPAALQLTAYRIAQESLANVRRHSTATNASVVVRVGTQLEVEVVDNGTAIHGTSGTGLGQQGIRERAELLKGEVEMGRRHGSGYRVRVTLPLTPPERSGALVAGPNGATR